MKALRTNRIYLKGLNKEQEREIKDTLTYKIPVKHSGGTRGIFKKEYEILRNYKSADSGRILSIPGGRVDLIPKDFEVVDNRTHEVYPWPDPKLQLRDDQRLVVDAITDYGFINAQVGWGKTFAALHLAHKLSQKTLVITHTTMLRDQWIEEAQKLFGMPIGIIGSGIIDYDHVLTIANVQTFHRYAEALKKAFGTIILDEAHHCPATTFTEIVDTMYARYRIGLSGTLNRTDGKHVVFTDFFGHNIQRPEQANTINPVVKILKSGLTLKQGVPWVQKINDLLYDPDYQEFIATVAKRQMNLGHSVLVLADRVEFLERVQEIIGESCVCIVGGTSYDERKTLMEQVDRGEKKVVAGSRQIFSEGISLNRLSCAILAVPSANEILLEQLIGRIMRKHPEKPDPVVIDINFSGSSERKQNEARLAFYIKKGWEIKGV